MTSAPPKIKAIETRYKGHRFRSRLEARWAVVFDAAGIEWRYEEQGFELVPQHQHDEHLGAYLPDFYLPAFHTYVEVKPELPEMRGGRTTVEYDKLHRLCCMKEARGTFCASLVNGCKGAFMMAVDHTSRRPGDWPFAIAPTSLRCAPIDAFTVEDSYGVATTQPDGSYQVDRVWTSRMVCPVCQGEYVHEGSEAEPGSPGAAYASSDDYDALYKHYGANVANMHFRGGAMIMPYHGECGHTWDLVTGFHKGYTYIGAVFNPVDAEGCNPLMYVLDKQHFDTGRAARFEHGECG